VGKFLENAGSTITEDDLKNYTAFFDDPVWVEYQDYKVYETPPNS